MRDYTILYGRSKVIRTFTGNAFGCKIRVPFPVQDSTATRIELIAYSLSRTQPFYLLNESYLIIVKWRGGVVGQETEYVQILSVTNVCMRFLTLGRWERMEEDLIVWRNQNIIPKIFYWCSIVGVLLWLLHCIRVEFRLAISLCCYSWYCCCTELLILYSVPSRKPSGPPPSTQSSLQMHFIDDWL